MHTILLNHLLIPTGASPTQGFNLSGSSSPIPTYLPKTLKNFKHISYITSINLSFNLRMFLRLAGPSGTHYVFGHWVGPSPLSLVSDYNVLWSLTMFYITGVERLMIDQYTTSPPTRIEKSPVYLTLLLMNNLRTLKLTDCLDLPFVLALGPKKHPSGTVFRNRFVPQVGGTCPAYRGRQCVPC